MNTLQEWLPSFAIPFFTLSHPVAKPAEPDSFPQSSYYTTGILDGCLIITCIAVMAILRDVLRLTVFEPFARWKLTSDLKRQRARLKKAAANGNGKINGVANGAAHAKTNGVANGNGHIQDDHQLVKLSAKETRKLRRSVTRFAEQGWSFVYYTWQFSFGLYVHRNLPTKVLDPIDVWLNYPHIPLAGPLKFYYLAQTAFYLHQILILNAEARRKDHWQMMTHHIITAALMISSYSYNYTRIGCLIMLLMDWCDIFLPLAKMFRYIAYSTLCDVVFAFFLVSWVVTRHGLFLIAIESFYTDAHRLIPRVWDPERGHFMNQGVYVGFVVLLVALQLIQIMWCWMICRVAWRVISGQGAEDSRSDSEGDNEDEDEGKKDR